MKTIFDFNYSNCKLKFFLVENCNSAKVAFISVNELTVQCPKDFTIYCFW